MRNNLLTKWLRGARTLASLGSVSRQPLILSGACFKTSPLGRATGHDSNRAAQFQDANPAAWERLIVRLSLHLPENFPTSSFNSSFSLSAALYGFLFASALFFFFYVLPAEIIKTVSPLLPAPPPPPALLSLSRSREVREAAVRPLRSGQAARRRDVTV